MKYITSADGIDHLIRTYQHYLRNAKGLAPHTCAVRASKVKHFLIKQWKRASGHLTLSKLRAPDILKYVTGQGTRYKPTSLQHLASTLRSFLRFLILTGQAPAELVHAVPKIQAGPRVASPDYLSETQLATLLKSLDAQTSCGARDQALVLCLVQLGLRAGEAAGLVLEDLNWRQATLRLIQTKGQRERLLPLTPEVGKALAHYLKCVRPTTTTHRRVFVGLPHGGPLSGRGVSALIAEALRRTHLIFPRPGAQLLRRTFATHLAQRGCNIKVIADLLGHRYLNSTGLYVHVNLPLLQTVAQPWPEVVA